MGGVRGAPGLPGAPFASVPWAYATHELSTRGSLAFAAAATACASGADVGAGAAVWRLEELARVGGSDEGLGSFNVIGDMQLAPDGRLWVLDRQVQSLRLFEADGAPLKEVARRGSGPGELGKVAGFRLAPGGGVVVRDYANGRVLRFTAAGEAAGEQRSDLFGGVSWDGVIDAEGRTLELVTVFQGKTQSELMQLRRSRGPSAVLTPRPSRRRARSSGPTGTRSSSRAASSTPFRSPRAASVRSRTTVHSGAGAPTSTDCGVSRSATPCRELVVGGEGVRLPIATQRATPPCGCSRSALAKGGAGEPRSNRSLAPADHGPVHALLTDDERRLWVLRGATQAGGLRSTCGTPAVDRGDGPDRDDDAGAADLSRAGGAGRVGDSRCG